MNPREILDEMNQRVEKHGAPGWIVCWFQGGASATKPPRAVLIDSDDPDALAKLNAVVEQGGEPVGFGGFSARDAQPVVTFYSEVFPEYADDQWIRLWFDAWTEGFRKSFKQRFGRDPLPDPNPDEN